MGAHWLKLGALAAVLIGGWLVWRLPAVQQIATAEHILGLREEVRGVWWAAPVFVAAYAALAAVDFSGLVLTVIGGVVFGFERAVVLNTLGANLGANAAYGLARLLGKDAVAAFLGPRFDRLRHFVEAGGFVWLLRLRLIPVVPFNLLNFGAGLAGMPWRAFAGATAIGILPGTVIYTLSADAIVRASGDASGKPFTWLLVAGALLLLLTFVPALGRRFGWLPVER